MIDPVQRSASRAADGFRLLPGDQPFARALRGEVVDQGDRIEIVLPDGTFYRGVVISDPIICDGKVVSALSVWQYFDKEIQDLVDSLK